MNLDNLLLASDTARVQAGGSSMFDNLGNKLLAGSAGAVVSGLASIYNTGVWASNSAFGTQADAIDTGKVLGKVDANWRTFYEENQSVIDTIGFIGGSFAPGGLALKGLNIARTGESLGAFRSALGYTTRNQSRYLEAGLSQIASDGTAVFASINKNKVASMVFGAADSVLQTAVFETAAAITMQKSSLFDDKNWKDIAWDITTTSLAGGLLGGGIEALWTNKIFRDAGKAVDSKVRKYDTLVAANKLNLEFGDKTFAAIDAALDIPLAAVGADRVLPFTYRMNGKTVPLSLDVGALLDKTAASTFERGLLKFETALTDAVGSDHTVGRPLAVTLLSIVKEGRAGNKTDGEIRQKLGDYLLNLHRVEGLAASSVDFTKDVFYLVPGANLAAATAPDAAKLFSPVRASTGDRGYRIVGDTNTGRYGTLGTGDTPATLKSAWEAGFDIVLSGAAGKIHINPNSTIYKAVTDNKDNFLRTTMNVRTQQMSDTPIATIADMAAGGAPNIAVSGVQAGKYTFQFSTGSFTPTLDSIQNTARHLWATQLDSLANTTINARDFSLLDRLAVLAPGVEKDFKIQLKMADGTVIPYQEIGKDYHSWLAKQKLDAAVELLNKADGQLDMRQLAYTLNVEQSWLERAQAAGWTSDFADVNGAFRQLESYSSRENIVMVYKKAPIADPANPEFATGLLGYEYRKQLAMQQAETASASVLGKDGERFLDLDPKQALNFDGTGAGPTAAGFSNAGYADPARRWAQDTGRAVHLTQQSRVNEGLAPLQPHMAKFIQDNDKELGAVLARGRQTDHHLALFDGRLVDLASLKRWQKLQDDVARGMENPQALQNFQFTDSIPLSPKMAAFFSDYQAGHSKWLNSRKELAAAQGRTILWDEQALYFPPIDTKNFQHFAFVRGREGRVFGSTESTMITAKTPEKLRELIAVIEREHPDLQVVLKNDSIDYFKAKGEYEYSSGMNSPQLDAYLRKQGKLGDFIPQMDAKTAVEVFVQHVARREESLVRDAVSVKYGQTFEELKWLSDQYIKLESSKFGFFGKGETKKISDPFGDYRRLALNVSKQSEYRLWSDLNEFVDALGTGAYRAAEEAFKTARVGKSDWEEANAALERVGLRGVFSSQLDYLARQAGNDRSLAKLAVSKGNVLLANIALRLDAANALINTISSPILLGMEVSSIRNSIKRDPEVAAAFERQLTLTSPDGLKIPSTSKLIARAIQNYWGADKAALIDRYQNTVGSIRADAAQFHDMMASLALTPNMSTNAWAKNVDKAVEFGAKWTGNNMAEQFTRFVSSDVMRQITEPVVAAGRMSVKEQNSYIAIFTNRTQGNYISSQRPIMFQGVIGTALSLFQTYQFNMFQNLFRHVENRDGKTIAVGAALQSTLFGLNGLPLFDAINTHLIGNANINTNHRDVYSQIAAMDKDIGDFALYGAVSAFPLFSDKAPALYTRGDLNPRHITIVPTSFKELPVVEGFSRVAKAVVNFGQQVMNGGELGSALLQGMEHNGISRPLAGFAQVLQGRSTTGQGSMIAVNNDLMSIATATRLLGAKPIDESVALNHKFRMNAYVAADKERLEILGAVVKQKILAGGLEEDDLLDFAGRYAAAGGRVQNYSQALQRWTKDATTSEVNTIMRAHGSTRGQRLFEVMGGDELPDLTNQPELPAKQ